MPVNVNIDEDGVGEVELDWPERGNAIGPEEADEIVAAFERCSREGIRVAILCGRGDTFCAGGNLLSISELVKGGAEAVRSVLYSSFQGLFRAIATSTVPVLAAVDGPAIGLGGDLALACGVTYMGRRGWLRQGWAALGLIPAVGGVEYLRRRGGSQALWQYTVADRVNAESAAELGLAVSVPDARYAAQSAAQSLARLPDGVVTSMQELLSITDLDRHLAEALDRQVALLVSDDFSRRAAGVLRRGMSRKN